jgi:hypothetical protein
VAGADRGAAAGVSEAVVVRLLGCFDLHLDVYGENTSDTNRPKPNRIQPPRPHRCLDKDRQLADAALHHQTQITDAVLEANSRAAAAEARATDAARAAAEREGAAAARVEAAERAGAEWQQRALQQQAAGGGQGKEAEEELRSALAAARRQSDRLAQDLEDSRRRQQPQRFPAPSSRPAGEPPAADDCSSGQGQPDGGPAATTFWEQRCREAEGQLKAAEAAARVARHDLAVAERAWEDERRQLVRELKGEAKDQVGWWGLDSTLWTQVWLDY